MPGIWNLIFGIYEQHNTSRKYLQKLLHGQAGVAGAERNFTGYF
jgi:hypothetical protein